MIIICYIYKALNTTVSKRFTNYWYIINITPTIYTGLSIKTLKAFTKNKFTSDTHLYTWAERDEFG